MKAQMLQANSSCFCEPAKGKDADWEGILLTILQT